MEIRLPVGVPVGHADEVVHGRDRRVPEPQTVVDRRQRAPDDGVGGCVTEDLLDGFILELLLVGAVLGVQQRLDRLVRGRSVLILRTAGPGVLERLGPAPTPDRGELPLGARGRSDAAGAGDPDAGEELGVPLPPGAVDAPRQSLAEVADQVDDAHEPVELVRRHLLRLRHLGLERLRVLELALLHLGDPGDRGAIGASARAKVAEQTDEEREHLAEGLDDLGEWSVLESTTEDQDVQRDLLRLGQALVDREDGEELQQVYLSEQDVHLLEQLLVDRRRVAPAGHPPHEDLNVDLRGAQELGRVLVRQPAEHDVGHVSRDAGDRLAPHECGLVRAPHGAGGQPHRAVIVVDDLPEAGVLVALVPVVLGRLAADVGHVRRALAEDRDEIVDPGRERFHDLVEPAVVAGQHLLQFGPGPDRLGDDGVRVLVPGVVLP